MTPLPLLEFARLNGPPDGVPGDVAYLFEKLALEVAATGRKRFSADAVIHRIRWFHQIERNNTSFKINDHASSVLARWFLARHPKLNGFFELRERRGEAA